MEIASTSFRTKQTAFNQNNFQGGERMQTKDQKHQEEKQTDNRERCTVIQITGVTETDSEITH